MAFSNFRRSSFKYTLNLFRRNSSSSKRSVHSSTPMFINVNESRLVDGFDLRYNPRTGPYEVNFRFYSFVLPGVAHEKTSEGHFRLARPPMCEKPLKDGKSADRLEEATWTGGMVFLTT